MRLVWRRLVKLAILAIVAFVLGKFFTFSFVREGYSYLVPKTIRMLVYDGKILKFITNASVPAVNNDEVLVKVRSYAVNIPEYCRDFSGVIIAKGKNVEGFEYQNRVFGRISSEKYKELTEKNSICPEVIALKYKNANGQYVISKKPLSLTHVQAANIPYISDYLTEFMSYNFKKNDEILVTNGISTLGSVLVYYLKNHSKVVATEENQDELSKFRLLSHSDFKSDDEFRRHLSENKKKFDYIFNIPGSTMTSDDLNKIIKDGGTIFDLNSHKKLLIRKGVNIVIINNENSKLLSGLDLIADMINRGKIPVMVEKTFEMQNLQQAIDFKKQNQYNEAVNISISKVP